MKQSRFAFYQDLVTQQSWQILQNLKKHISFILIGGWAVYLYTNGLKSKDIDIIIDYAELQKLKKSNEFYKNARLKKYEIKNEGIDIDIYLPYFSQIGLPVEELMSHTTSVQTFTILQKEALLITKIAAYKARKPSIKGQKDLVDIISLLMLNDFDFTFFNKLLKKYGVSEYNKMIVEILKKTREIGELKVNRHFFAKKKKEILTKL